MSECACMSAEKTNFEKVREFHDKFLQKRLGHVGLKDPAFIKLRLGLIDEEVKELKDAIEANDIVEVVDALSDILYVVYGFADQLDVNIDSCFREVHESNMSKLGEDGKPIFREDGKIMKGPNFFRPNLRKFI